MSVITWHSQKIFTLHFSGRSALYIFVYYKKAGMFWGTSGVGTRRLKLILYLDLRMVERCATWAI